MKRLLSLILALLLTVSCLCGAFALTASAANDNKKRVIAIVFDNSGSMYMSGNTAWCRATYAMEVFATMMNPSDEMYIYPMNSIAVNGQEYTSRNPLKVTQSNASIIRSIFTTDPAGTPIESITHAYEGIKSKSADEKWLIVLTDGNKFYKNDSELSSSKTKAELEAVLSDCANGMNTMYLGIGKAVDPVFSGSYKTDHKVATNSADVLKMLSAMCNTVFGRDSLPSGNMSGDTVTFDVSMSKLIVFIQGANIENVKLEGASPVSTAKMMYSTLTCEGSRGKEAKVDESLQGMLLTYGALDAGSYKLSYSGDATSVVAYYEPDVDLKVVLKDASGNEVDPKGELYPGDYTVEYALVDRNGNPTTSSLLGSVDYKITYKKNGNTEVVSDNKSGSFKLTMDPDDTLESDFDVTYLDGYSIHRSGVDLGWPTGGLKFLPPPAGHLEIQISGGASSYNLTALDNASPFRVDFIYEGTKLTGSQLDSVQATATLSGGNATCELKRDDQGYFAVIGYSGSLVDVQAGSYELAVGGIYTNEDGENTNNASKTAQFEIVDNSGQLGMELVVEQDYYLIKELADGKPIRVNLTLNGVPLTDEQLASVNFICASEGLKFKTELINGESAINVWIDPSTTPEPDGYDISFKASCKNEIGRDVMAEQETDIQVRNLPRWLRILIPILIILLIITLIVLYMRMKVLPDKLLLEKCSFVVNGKRLNGTPKFEFQGGGKSRGSISISAPKCASKPLAKAGLSLSVEAISPRYVRSKQRKLNVTASSPSPRTNVTEYKVGMTKFVRKEVQGKVTFVKSGSSENAAPKPIKIGGNSAVQISARFVDGTSVTFSGYLKTK